MSKQIIWRVDVCRRIAVSEAGVIRYARFGHTHQITSLTISDRFKGARVSLCHAALRAILAAEYQRHLEASARLHDDRRDGTSDTAKVKLQGHPVRQIRPALSHRWGCGAGAHTQEGASDSTASNQPVAVCGKRDDWQGVPARDGHRPVHIVERIEKSRPAWPTAAAEQARLTPAELAMLLEGHDWRSWNRTEEPVPKPARRPASTPIVHRGWVGG